MTKGVKELRSAINDELERDLGEAAGAEGGDARQLEDEPLKA